MFTVCLFFCWINLLSSTYWVYLERGFCLDRIGSFRGSQECFKVYLLQRLFGRIFCFGQQRLPSCEMCCWQSRICRPSRNCKLATSTNTPFDKNILKGNPLLNRLWRQFYVIYLNHNHWQIELKTFISNKYNVVNKVFDGLPTKAITFIKPETKIVLNRWADCWFCRASSHNNSCEQSRFLPARPKA